MIRTDITGKRILPNMFDDKHLAWRGVPEAKKPMAFAMAERLFLMGDTTLADITEFTLVPLKFLLINIQQNWREKFNHGDYPDAKITREQWDGSMTQNAKGPKRNPLTELELAVRTDYALGMGTRALSSKYKITRDKAKDIIAKHGGVERVPAIPQFNPKS